MHPLRRMNTGEAADDFGKGAAQSGGREGLERVRSLALSLLVELESLEMAGAHEIGNGFSCNDEVQRFEVNLIKRALLRTGGNQRRAARLLGLGPTTLYEKIKRYGINVERELDASRSDCTPTDVSDRGR